MPYYPKFMADARAAFREFHRYGPLHSRCPKTRKIPPKSRVYFDRVTTAKSHGYKKCRVCFPARKH
jgi:hypothetical protein